MKEYYKITEVARLYGLCTDTLRYYEEQGLLHPHRSEAGYRLYSIDDICNLNVIRALRELDMPVEHMRRYFGNVQWPPLDMLDSRTLPSGRALPPCGTRVPPWMRRARLERYDGQEPGLPAGAAGRPCLQLQEDVILEREIDFALKKLAHRHEEVIRALGTQCMGAVLDESQRARGIYNHFCSVFYLGCRRREADGALPAGAYASVFYRGPYSQLADVCAALWPRLAAQGLRQDGPVMELYHIDAHDTARVDEYLTEVQVRVARAGQKGSGEHGV
ncbi:MAG: MerR family transcriptional regulator [Ruthenibacterium lactatiformans]